MKTVVITGGTRGIGHGLAESFLDLGCVVTICGRSQTGVDQAIASLAAEHRASNILGRVCDVTDPMQVQALWDAAKKQFGHVDIWINNAGISHLQGALWEQSPEQIAAVVSTNVIGLMYGTRTAIRGMLEQGFGGLYNMEGLGSDGRKVEGLTLYGATKSAIRYLNDGLMRETRGTPVLVGALSPGMVVTDMILEQYKDRPQDWEQAARIFNLLADRVETVAPWLAQKVLANNKKGARISWLTRRKTIGRFITAPFRKRDLFD